MLGVVVTCEIEVAMKGLTGLTFYITVNTTKCCQVTVETASKTYRNTHDVNDRGFLLCEHHRVIGRRNIPSRASSDSKGDYDEDCY